MAKTRPNTQQDHVDVFLERWGDRLPVDLETEAIVDRIQGLAKRFRRSMEETLVDFDLTFGEWGMLGHLNWAGPSTPGQLAKKAELSSGAMTNRLDRLEDAGLIRRVPAEHDRRSTVIELTKKGEELWSRAVSAQGEKEALVASALNQREKKELNALLRRLMLVFEEVED
jgi:DNA-binding MarR family transcriptional regulator